MQMHGADDAMLAKDKCSETLSQRSVTHKIRSTLLHVLPKLEFQLARHT